MTEAQRLLAKGIDIQHIGWAGACVMIAGFAALCFVGWLFFR